MKKPPHSKNRRPKTTDFLQTTDCGLQTTDYRLQTTDCGLQTTDYRLQTNPAFTLIEVILTLVILTVFMGAAAVLFLSTKEGAQTTLDYSRATFLAKEGIEAMRSIRDVHFLNLKDGVYGLVRGTEYNLGPAPEIIDKVFERKITIESVYRDVDGDIVSAPGAIDPEIKKITAEVSFPGMNIGTRRVKQSTYLSNWRAKEFTHTLMSDFSRGTFSNTQVVSTPPLPMDNGALKLESIFAPDGFYSSANIGEHGNDVAVSKDSRYVFVTTAKSQAGLAVIDISEPDDLKVVATLDIGGKGKGMALKDNLLAIGIDSRQQGFALVDVSDPQRPAIRSVLNIPDTIVKNIVLDGNFAYVTTNRAARGLVIINISNPESPQTISSVDFERDGTCIEFVDTMDKKIVLVGKEYVGLVAIDITNPYQPVLFNELNFGDHRYPSGIIHREPFILASIATGSYEFYVLAVNHEGDAQIIKQMNLSGGDTDDISESGNLIAIAMDNTNNGIIILDVSNPANPKVLEYKDINHKAYGLVLMPPYIAVATDTANEGFVLVGSGNQGYAPSGTYISPAIDIGSENPEYISVDFEGQFPQDSYIGVELRSADSIATLASAAWSEVYTQSPSRLTLPAKRYVQYRVTLSGNSMASPVVDSIIIKYLP